MEDKEGREDDLIHKINRISLPAAILIGSLILGGIFYLTQSRKQNSIEKQQQVELNLQKEKDEMELNLQKEKDKLEYANTRRAECLKIYQTESDKWNNTKSYEYVAKDDICYVSYKAQQGEWKGVDCDEIGEGWNYELFGVDDPLTRFMWRRSANCSNAQFEKEY